MAIGAEYYGLDIVFEVIVAKHCSASPHFWGAVGSAIDADAIQEPTARIVLQACAMIAKELGRGPPAPLIVLQRLSTWMAAGKLKASEVSAARELLQDAVEEVGSGFYDEEAVLNELKPHLVRRLEKNALRHGLDVYAKRGDLSIVTDMLARAKRVGTTSETMGNALSEAIFTTIFDLRDAKRCPVGIPELDAALEGGPPNGTYNVVMGSTNAGKSMLLSHASTETVALQGNVAYATLESNEARTFARIIASLVEIQTNDILRYKDSLQEAQQRVQHLITNSLIGCCLVKYFSPDVTDVQEVFDWVDREEQARGLKIHALMLDSGNQLIDSKKKIRHEQQESVSAKCRDYANTTDHVVWSSAHTDSAGMDVKKVKRVELHNVAYSKGIVRAADIVVTLNPKDEGMVYYVGKNRVGVKGQEIGPIPTQFEYGRMVGMRRLNWPSW